MAGIRAEYAFIETYMALVAYIVIHQIYVIAGDFIEAFAIPPLNIGIYIDKLASVRALLMAIADILEWGITQKGFGDAGSLKRLEDPSPRRIGSVMSFMAMLICRFYYLWVVYRSDNKSLIAFITLSVEGFWFGVFQMGFFAIGPEYNAFTSFALHVTGNFVFFFQLILESSAETRPHINSLYRVRVHGWISVVTTFIALGPWLYFCHAYVQGDSLQYKGLVGDLQSVSVSVTSSASEASASEIAKKLAEKMKDDTSAQSTKQKVKKLVEAEFGLTVQEVQATVETGVSPKTVTVEISGGDTENSSTTVTVKKTRDSGGSDAAEITITVRQARSKAVARRIARRLAKALTEVKEVTQTGSSTEKIDVTVTMNDKIDVINCFSPFLLFPLGSFFKDFIYPGILPYAFLDCEKANLINYTMPILYMCGPIFILLVNDVFSAEKSILGMRMKDYDSKFKEWSEGQAPGYHYMWLLNIPMFMVYLISLFAIHGIFPSLRVIVQSRWRVFVLTMVVLIPRSHLEVMDYVGVANYAIAAGDAGDFEGFTILSWNDMLSMFCRFCNGKLAVGYNWTRVSLGYNLQRVLGNFHGFQCPEPCF